MANTDLPARNKLLLYKTIIHPVLWYSIFPKIETLVRKFLGHCFGKQYESSWKRYSTWVIYAEFVSLIEIQSLNKIITRKEFIPDSLKIIIFSLFENGLINL